LKTATKPVASD